MNRLGDLWNLYHPIVWWIVAGTMLTRFTSFMVMPFMALYMKLHTCLYRYNRAHHWLCRTHFHGSRSSWRLTHFLGPWLGGWALSHIGGRALFVLTGIVVALGIPFYRWSNSWRLQQQSSAMKESTCL